MSAQPVDSAPDDEVARMYFELGRQAGREEGAAAAEQEAFATAAAIAAAASFRDTVDRSGVLSRQHDVNEFLRRAAEAGRDITAAEMLRQHRAQIDRLAEVYHQAYAEVEARIAPELQAVDLAYQDAVIELEDMQDRELEARAPQFHAQAIEALQGLVAADEHDVPAAIPEPGVAASVAGRLPAAVPATPNGPPGIHSLHAVGPDRVLVNWDRAHAGAPRGVEVVTAERAAELAAMHTVVAAAVEATAPAPRDHTNHASRGAAVGSALTA